jgi:hypothetical protein
MMKKVVYTFSLVVICGLFAFLLSSCRRPNVVLSPYEYQPSLANQADYYKNKPINLMWVVNRANDTSTFYYYDPEGTVFYEASPTMERYFTKTFERALVSLGMKVSPPDQPTPKAPGLQFTLISMNDMRFVFQAQLFAQRNIAFTKTYTITGPPKPETGASTDINALRQRSYEMTNQVIKTVLGDPEFKKAYAAGLK